LNVGSDSHAVQTAKILCEFEKVCLDYKPDLIVVVGDVNSTMACSLVAAKMNIKVVHIEAGIRSNDRTMPEEVNRLVTDSIASYLLPPSQDAVENLLREGHSKESIKLVGNVMIDTLMKFQPKIQDSLILEKLNLTEKEYVAVTIHRPSNTDNKETFLKILSALKHIQKSLKVVFPIHPRTKKMISDFGLDETFKNTPNLIFTEPLGYFDFGKLVSNSKFVVTDSGGIQEETTVYGIPCITIRENTERPITITEGTNAIAGTDTELIISMVDQILDGKWKTGTIPKYWDGHAGKRIVEFLTSL